MFFNCLFFHLSAPPRAPPPKTQQQLIYCCTPTGGMRLVEWVGGCFRPCSDQTYTHTYTSLPPPPHPPRRGEEEESRKQKRGAMVNDLCVFCAFFACPYIHALVMHPDVLRVFFFLNGRSTAIHSCLLRTTKYCMQLHIFPR